ncbi:hypothetical protein [Helicobacter felis]|uniref:hypothetical protein n=1 Tax=Helicobacter felis TaxID=214 RepID=UPI000CF069F3|nr:hypothetical protein [Helicobacter felis]
MGHFFKILVFLGLLAVMLDAKEGAQDYKSQFANAPKWVVGDLDAVPFKGYKRWGLGVGEAKIVNGDVSTALKIALMKAQQQITRNLFHGIKMSLDDGKHIFCCPNYWSTIFIGVQLARQTVIRDNRGNIIGMGDMTATKTAILERDVYDHIAVKTEKLATWTNDKKVWVLAGIKQDKLRQICAYFDPKSQTIACQIEQKD